MKGFALAIPLALLLIGCGSSASTENAPSSRSTSTTGNASESSSASVVGKWKVAPDFIEANKSMKPEGFMTGFASTFWYELKADNTFQGSMSEGTYKVTGDKVVITTTKLMGKDQPGVDMTGDLTEGGKTLTLHPPANGMLPKELASGIKMAKE